jgi:hypothetical protein
MGKAKNMNVVDQVKEETQKIMQFKSSYKIFPFILGPLFPPPRALHIKPELFYFVFKEGTLHP